MCFDSSVYFGFMFSGVARKQILRGHNMGTSANISW